MSHNAEQNGSTPEWHLEILSKREQNIKEGKSKFNDLKDAKSRLQKLA